MIYPLAEYHAAGVAFWIADVDQLAATLGVATGQLPRQTLLRLRTSG